MSDAGRRRRRPPRWVRSVGRRPVSFLALLVLSALAVAVSALTPMLLRSVQAEALAQSFQRGSTFDTSIAVTAQTSNGSPIGDAVYAAQSIAGGVGPAWLWHAPVSVVVTPYVQKWAAEVGSRPVQTGFITLNGDARCAGIPVVIGHCPVLFDEALVPLSTYRRLHLSIGTEIDLDPGPQAQPAAAVIGVYDDARGFGRTLAAPDALVGAPLTTSTGSLMIGAGKVESLGLTFAAYSSVSVRQPLTLTEVPAIESAVARAKRATLSLDAGEASTQVTTGISTLLGHVGLQQAAAATITTATALEALALAWFALAYLIQRISRVRAVEWGIGRTRGIKRRAWLASVFLEPAVAVVIGGLVGFPAGTVLARGIADAAIGSGVPVDPFQPIVLAAAALALVGSLVALVAASVRSARLPLTALLRETTEPRRISRLALVAQVGVVLVTAVVVWAVVTQPTISGPQVALLTPALVALVVGIVALRLTVVVVRGATARSPRSLGGLVVGRQLARAPSSLSAAVMVAVGLALAGYVVSLFIVAERLQDDRADADVAATTVLHVVTPQGTSLLSAVRQADPGGRAAMAVQEVSGSGANDTGRIVAVDTPRLAAVTTWREAWWGRSAASLLRQLDPPAGPGLLFRGTRLAFTVKNLGGSPSEPLDPDGEVRLEVEIASPKGWTSVDYGLLRDGTLANPDGPLPCTDGCRLISLTVEDPNSTTTGPFGLVFDLTAISTDTQPASTFEHWLTRAGWRDRVVDEADPTQPDRADGTASGAGLHLEFDADVGGVTPTVEPDVGTATLPAVLGAATATAGFPNLPHTVFGSDLERNNLLLTVVGRATVLPRVGSQGALVDLGQLARLSDAPSGQSENEVWLAPGSHPAVLAALKAQGIRIVSTQTVAAVQAEYRQEAPVRALGLTLATAAAALLLTVLALVAARWVGAGTRRRDRATLEVAGVRSRTLARLTAIEFAVPTAVGAVLGVAAGVAAYALTVLRLPLLAGDGASPPPDLSPPALALALLVVGAVAVAALLGAAIGAAESRGAR